MTIAIQVKSPNSALSVFAQIDPQSGEQGFVISPSPYGSWVSADETQRLVDYLSQQLPKMQAENRRNAEQRQGQRDENGQPLTTAALQAEQDKVAAGHGA